MCQKKKGAVFLDRDGVLTVERGYVSAINEVEIFPYAKECVEQIHRFGLLAIVITNQSGVARGLFTKSQLEAVHKRLKRETEVDAVYYCPHHPKGIVPEFTCVCNCRKPSAGMIKQACKDYEIDLQASYMVGDRAADIMLGQGVDIPSILVESGYGSAGLEAEVVPDYICEDLREAVDVIRTCLENNGERG